MMKMLTAVVLMVGLAFGASYVQTQSLDFLSLNATDTLNGSSDTSRSYAFSWGDAPTMSISWNAYGDAATTYVVGVRWADGTGHFVKDLDTVITCTVGASESTRATARRYTEQVSRPVSEYGQIVMCAASDTMYVDSLATVKVK